MSNESALTSLVRGVLEDPLRYEWSLQGFGMLRTYFTDRVRLQVWDHKYEIPGNNAVHDHPWDFRSTIVAGVLRNQRFMVDHDPPHPTRRPYHCQRIRPGMEGIEHGAPTVRQLWTPSLETYGVGDSYEQEAKELHRTDYDDGTVTLIVRERVVAQDLAWSCWPVDLDGDPPWVLFRVREATTDEVLDITARSLGRWFDGADPISGEQGYADE